MENKLHTKPCAFGWNCTPREAWMCFAEREAVGRNRAHVPPLKFCNFPWHCSYKNSLFSGFQNVLWSRSERDALSHFVTTNMYKALTCYSYNVSQPISFILYEQPIVETVPGFLYRWQNWFRETVTWLRLSKLVPGFEASLFLPAFIVFNLYAEAQYLQTHIYSLTLIC